MPNLHDIERRIKSVESTKQITRTMQMVAAAKIRHSTQRVEAATPYGDAVKEMLANIARMGGTHVPLTMPHDEVKKTLIVVIASDRGLAGGFNSSVLRRAEQIMKERKAEGQEVVVAACGKKAISYFKYRKIETVLAFRDLSADPRVEESDALADYAIEHFLSGDIDEVVVLYNHAKNAGEQVLIQQPLLPVDPKAFLPKGETFNKGGGITEPTPDDLDVQGAIEYEPGEQEVLVDASTIKENDKIVIHMGNVIPFDGCRAGCSSQRNEKRDGQRHRHDRNPRSCLQPCTSRRHHDRDQRDRRRRRSFGGLNG